MGTPGNGKTVKNKERFQRRGSDIRGICISEM